MDAQSVPVFTVDELTNAETELDEVSHTLNDVIAIAVKVRRAGKFKKEHKDLLEQFDKMLEVDLTEKIANMVGCEETKINPSCKSKANQAWQ